MRQLPFDDGSFHVVVSSLAIHNVPGAGAPLRRNVARAITAMHPGARVRFDAVCCQGIMTNVKTLDAPVLDRLLDPVGRILTPEVARGHVRLRFDPKAQTHIKKLARKCNKGKLTEVEQREYEAYVYAIDFIAILQAKARNLLKGLREAE
jgi:hypothetical protein